MFAHSARIDLRRLTGATRRAVGLRPTGESRLHHDMPERHSQGDPTALLFYPLEALRQWKPQNRNGSPVGWDLPAKNVSASPSVAQYPPHLPAQSRRHRAIDASACGQLMTT